MFKVTENNGVTTTYPNITHITEPKHMNSKGIIVVAWIEGEPDLWLLEDGKGIDSLMSYYEQQWHGNKVTYNLLRNQNR